MSFLISIIALNEYFENENFSYKIIKQYSRNNKNNNIKKCLLMQKGFLRTLKKGSTR